MVSPSSRLASSPASRSTEALFTKRMIDVAKRAGVGLVLEDDGGDRRPASGPLMVSFTSEADLVTRAMVPIAMTLNSIFLRFRDRTDPATPSQRSLGIRTAGHVPFLFSHDVTVRGDEVVLTERAEGEPLRQAFRRARDAGALNAVPGLVYGQGGGCSCRAGSGGPPDAALLLALGLLPLALRRRRREVAPRR